MAEEFSREHQHQLDQPEEKISELEDRSLEII